MATSTTEPTPSDYFPTMMRIASDAGCQLEQAPDNPTLLRGYCPFHDAEGPRAIRTLQVNTRSIRFWCQLCSAQGNPIAFASMNWGISAADAHRILADTGTPMGSRRPPYPPGFFDTPEDRPHTPRPQNTAVLTRAAQYYSEQMFTNYPPLQLLARMAVTPQDAARAGVGYCPGTGLRDFLANLDITPQELDDTPLLNSLTGLETFTGRITISDNDFTGASTWMTSLMPEESTPKMEWRARRPSTYGIPGLRSYLVNLYSISRRNPRAVITDDPRLYIILATNDIPCALVTQRQRADTDQSSHAQRVARAVTSRGARQVSVALHDRTLRALTVQALNHTLRNQDVTAYGRLTIMNTINPMTRDLEAISPRSGRAPAAAPRATSQQQPAHQETDPRDQKSPAPGEPGDTDRQQDSPPPQPELNGAQDTPPPAGVTKQESLAQSDQGQQQDQNDGQNPEPRRQEGAGNIHPNPEAAREEAPDNSPEHQQQPDRPAGQQGGPDRGPAGEGEEPRPSEPGGQPRQRDPSPAAATTGPRDPAGPPTGDPQSGSSAPEPAPQSGSSSG